MVVKKVIERIVNFVLCKHQKGVLLNFEQEKQRILEENSRYIIEKKLVPYIISDTLYRENYLMTEKDAYKIATQMFLDGKASGKIDNMNRLVKELV